MTRTHSRWAKVAALAAATSLALAACGGGGSNEGGSGDGTPKDGGSYVNALYLEPLGLDPHRQAFWETYRVSRNIFESLVQEDTTDPTGPAKLVPGLATEWEASDDAKVWTFTLREGVTFHDGSPFDAEALDKNVQRVSDPSYEYFDDQSKSRLEAWFGNFVGGTVVDDYTYRFEFSEPSLGFPRGLAQAMGTLPIGNPASWETHGNEKAADHPDGTGPYTFVSRKIGDRIVLKKNPDYWGEEPHLDELVFRIIPNNQTRLAALLSGEVDQISYVQPEDVETLEDQGFQVPDGHGAAYLYLSYNFTNPDLKKQEVREALIYGLDRDKLAKEVFNGYATPAFSTLHLGNEAHDPEARDFGYDPQKAKALLEKAGYGPGDLTFTIVIDVANQNLAEWLQNQYKQIGIETKIEALDRPSYGARIGTPKPTDGFDVSEYGGSYAEWLDYVVTAIGGKAGSYLEDEYPELLSAISKAEAATDPDQRIKLWQAADEELRKAALTVPAVTLTKYYGLGPNVKGFVWPANNGYDLSKVWLDN